MTGIVISGVGALTALGDATTTWERLLAGRSAVQRWEDLEQEGFGLPVAARVVDDRVPDGPQRGRTLARLTAGAALSDAGLLTPAGLPEASRVGVFVGTTMGESAVFEQPGFTLAEGGGHVFAEAIAAQWALGGPVRTLGTACAAGNYAVGLAARAVAAGRCDIALAGGVEPFSRIALVGFGRMRAMAPAGCQPFTSQRRGMSLGEGAGLVVIESALHCARRGGKPLAVVGGLGLAADAHHPTAPLEDGSGMAAAMTAALREADLAPSTIGWISAHGTGTPRSDAAESLAIRSVFVDPPPVSSIKGAIGHTLGAATAIEAVIASLALRDGLIPPNVSAAPGVPDPDLGIDVVTTPREAAGLAWVMSNGFAFGGLNSALILGRP